VPPSSIKICDLQIQKKFAPSMTRMHTNSKGKSQSTLPYHTFYPSHITKTKQEIIDKILTLARKGIPASQIGNVLRDEEGVGQISAITHTTLVKILRLHNLAPAIPEDLNALVKKVHEYEGTFAEVQE
ncbi:40S ribosomal protein S13, partial [Trachipleistophora hominis]